LERVAFEEGIEYVVIREEELTPAAAGPSVSSFHNAKINLFFSLFIVLEFLF
jgi:hypothetical protein